MAERESSINIGQYLADKAAGITRVVRLNGQAFYSTKEFDRTGKPIVVNIPLAEQSLMDMISNIEAEIATRQNDLASVKQVLADIALAQELLV